ncbi:MAG: FAD-binding oxidoreductase [Pseudomonadota bacterium]
MPIPSSVASDSQIPTKVDVAIIGGGIAGVVTALELAERGQKVAIFDKGIIAGEQSSRNWGWCRKMGRDPRELPLIKIALQLWREMRQRTGEDVGFVECGIAYLCDTDKSLEKRAKWLETYGQAHGLSSRMIGPEEAEALAPGSTVSWKGGLVTPDDGRAEPTLAVPAMARAAQRLGATIHQNCAVRGLDIEAGRIAGIVTETARVKAEQTVLAGGVWSRRLLDNQGFFLPQLGVVNSVMRTKPMETAISHSIAGGQFAIRKRSDGGYTLAHSIYNTADILPDSFRLLRHFLPTLKDEWRDFRFRIGSRFFEEARLKRRWSLDEASPFEAIRCLDPAPVPSIQNEAITSLHRTLPMFRAADIAESWAGVIDVVPDVVPVIGPVETCPGLYILTGLSGHGFGLGPGAGKLMAEIVSGEEPCVDPSPFRYARFQ